MSAGKGDGDRVTDREAFGRNYDLIVWGRKATGAWEAAMRRARREESKILRRLDLEAFRHAFGDYLKRKGKK